MVTKNTWATFSNLSMLCPAHLIQAHACHLRCRSPLQDNSVYLVRYEPHYGGSYPTMESSRGPQVGTSIIWHARDGVWLCEWVMLPKPCSGAA